MHTWILCTPTDDQLVKGWWYLLKSFFCIPSWSLLKILCECQDIFNTESLFFVACGRNQHKKTVLSLKNYFEASPILFFANRTLCELCPFCTLLYKMLWFSRISCLGKFYGIWCLIVINSTLYSYLFQPLCVFFHKCVPWPATVYCLQVHEHSLWPYHTGRHFSDPSH